jgi:hypothetical protein
MHGQFRFSARFGGSAATLLLSLACLLSVCLTPNDVQATTGKVSELINKAGRAGVVRGPHTISKDQKAAVQKIASALSAKFDARVYFVFLPKSADNDTYASLYDSLGMKGADVLAVSNGSGLALRCSGLSKEAKTKVWEAFRGAADGPSNKFNALADTIAELMPGEFPATAEPEESDNSTGTAVFVVVLIAAVAAVIIRRKRRDTAILGDYKLALDPVEMDLTDMYLSMDGLEDRPGFERLLNQASDLSGKLDAIKIETPNRQAIAKLKTMSRDAAWLKDEMSKLRE